VNFSVFVESYLKGYSIVAGPYATNQGIEPEKNPLHDVQRLALSSTGLCSLYTLKGDSPITKSVVAWRLQSLSNYAQWLKKFHILASDPSKRVQ